MQTLSRFIKTDNGTFKKQAAASVFTITSYHASHVLQPLDVTYTRAHGGIVQLNKITNRLQRTVGPLEVGHGSFPLYKKVLPVKIGNVLRRSTWEASVSDFFRRFQPTSALNDVNNTSSNRQ